LRLIQQTDGRIHPLDGLATDHHAVPSSVDFQNTTQSLPPGTTYNLDITLGSSNYQFARIILIGPNVSADMGDWKECAELLVTRNSNEAISHSIRSAAVPKKVYCSTYSKQNSDAYLTHKIFNAGAGNYIAVQDAVLTSNVLRITFKNFYGGSMYLNVHGHVLLW
jgi:hypothetical protein